MFDNHVYNLMLQLVEEHKALWRIKRMYKKDSGKCKACKVLWGKMEKDKLAHVKELQGMIKKHIK
ncbi:MAG: hypothetical protein UX65_C0003G0016 [Parcubacteria group bacterium GW2011_GWB1_46_8]|nr:MAG: hypothetical protein UX14_C0012G0006 [Parcubacteria group bacterium GW2011_GWF1_45_5]KKU10710.1 MAG: hypothetical protein UX15_C0023G0004 [Parcubacteria group bacterium GW2011_GWA1_45_7]KKU43185.1 MAG: hypothetical protein UX61_C0027G0002 [Parcubacteria group bacterium GW2011_GWA2_46_7]KKU46473.1 MAG: hypothetical protein UX65_C0003G0016 [Parcubacteria group bacterium GW2011_GWB1_46_8]OGJ05214.1 MAG: hypothetical protein A2357_00950 [Candidatus Nomurabacteria bacterium RIFOXYB1_FULL_43_